MRQIPFDADIQVSWPLQQQQKQKTKNLEGRVTKLLQFELHDIASAVDSTAVERADNEVCSYKGCSGEEQHQKRKDNCDKEGMITMLQLPMIEVVSMMGFLRRIGPNEALLRKHRHTVVYVQNLKCRFDCHSGYA